MDHLRNTIKPRVTTIHNDNFSRLVKTKSFVFSSASTSATYQWMSHWSRGLRREILLSSRSCRGPAIHVYIFVCVCECPMSTKAIENFYTDQTDSHVYCLDTTSPRGSHLLCPVKPILSEEFCIFGASSSTRPEIVDFISRTFSTAAGSVITIYCVFHAIASG